MEKRMCYDNSKKIKEYFILANKNQGLTRAGKAKKDEFYTQLSDIQNELNHYI